MVKQRSPIRKRTRQETIERNRVRALKRRYEEPPVETAVKVYPSGREVCTDFPIGKVEYERRRTEMWHRDKGICCLCGRFVPFLEATFEHKAGRGMGGSRTDDRVEFNGIAHFWGNNRKGSVRYERYMELPLETRINNCIGK